MPGIVSCMFGPDFFIANLWSGVFLDVVCLVRWEILLWPCGKSLAIRVKNLPAFVFLKGV